MDFAYQLEVIWLNLSVISLQFCNFFVCVFKDFKDEHNASTQYFEFI